VIGVSDASFLDTIAGALARLGVDRALVVAAEDGLDELSIVAATKVVEVNCEEITRYTLAPADVGIEAVAADIFERDCAGGTPEHNAGVTRAVFGTEGAAPASPASIELAVINAGAAIYAAGVSDSIAEGVQAARAALSDGSAAQALERFVLASRANAPSEVAS
jgi:anthranilate phosphoribosyltransferase